ncbi:unnamed protein product [Linum tenue]|uniref:LysM domain-containing protein n=1 Tax=Linum tenue TaxID=586396 RepID=A0AAV0JGU4_9ROSI|nr:unnamed protein product [Linum tenue]
MGQSALADRKTHVRTDRSMVRRNSETAEKAWGYYCICMVMLLVLSCWCCHTSHHLYGSGGRCEEIYVVREGETLQTIGDKCGDPFIVEENPHIHDPDDVFPGLVIKINPGLSPTSSSSSSIASSS